MMETTQEELRARFRRMPSESALDFAEERLKLFEDSYLNDRVIDEAKQPLDWQVERIREKLPGGIILFGDITETQQIFYDSLFAGFDPTVEQINEKYSYESDFMWDEVKNLAQYHTSIYLAMSQYCHREVSSVGLVGSFAIPRDVVVDILAELYMRGEDYREWGWDYPDGCEKNYSNGQGEES